MKTQTESQTPLSIADFVGGGTQHLPEKEKAKVEAALLTYNRDSADPQQREKVGIVLKLIKFFLTSE